MIKTLLLISTLLVPNIRNKDNEKPPLVLFETMLRGTGFPPRMIGEIIDGEGRVHYFNAAKNKSGMKEKDWSIGKWDSLSNSWVMTPAEVEKNLSLYDSVVCTLPFDTLSKYIHLLYLVAESKSPLSEKKPTRVGGGVSSFYGFIYDDKRNIYKRILIEQHGDMEQHNTSKYVRWFGHWKWCR